ncbi:MAG TPA: tripartite tricarboxylate transporter substrate-binding protein [Xanthobacteraceae bacterium]|jgi:tripartite-type tricarboxylate transporter receptor subunit TctC|nr:tripartite tricarboxylate transporter substrate-binding protein [Xanthobacteraceae bacterium]
MQNLRLVRFVLALAAAGACIPAHAESDYPTETVRMIVGFPPAGGADLIARIVSDRLSAAFKKPVVVINRPGAGSSVAAAFVAKEAADGYTVLLATSSFTINPNLYTSVNYDPIKDFIPIAAAGNSPFGIVVKADSPIDSFAKLIQTAKEKPTALSYSSGGIGSMGNLAAELLKSRTGINLMHVPYKGLAPAIDGLLAGDVDMTFSDMASSLPFIKAGTLRVLAVTPSTRLPWVPSAPTIAESGVEGYNIQLWNGILVPAGTPADIVNKLHSAIVDIFKNPDPTLMARYDTIGETLPAVESRQAFEKFIGDDLVLWKKTISDAHITASN